MPERGITDSKGRGKAEGEVTGRERPAGRIEGTTKEEQIEIRQEMDSQAPDGGERAEMDLDLKGEKRETAKRTLPSKIFCRAEAQCGGRNRLSRGNRGQRNESEAPPNSNRKARRSGRLIPPSREEAERGRKERSPRKRITIRSHSH